jgi:hypothetical protein
MKPLTVDKTKVKTKPQSTAQVVGVSTADPKAFQINHASQAWDAT